MVAGYLDAVSTLDTHSQAFSDKISDIGKLGDEDIRASAAVSNRLLEKPIAAMTQGGLTEASSVSKSLLSLRHQVEDLDPSKQGDLLSPHKLLGLLPFGAGSKLEDYFLKYQSSQGHINAIITSLYHGQDELQRDNASIEQEKVNLWVVMGRLRQYAYLAQHLDTPLSDRVAALEGSDPERARVLKEDNVLFYIRQKHQDLLTQLAVSVQGYLALDVIRRNNLEAIKGVDRATTTTISALRTAVIVAQALSDQQLVLDQITALNTTTSRLIEFDLRDAPPAVGDDQRAGGIGDRRLARLQKAFSNIYATMDEIDTFKVAALDTMQTTSSPPCRRRSPSRRRTSTASEPSEFTVSVGLAGRARPSDDPTACSSPSWLREGRSAWISRGLLERLRARRSPCEGWTRSSSGRARPG